MEGDASSIVVALRQLLLCTDDCLDPELDNVETQMVVRYKPEGLDALCRLTKFTRKELQIMYRGFKQVACIFLCSVHFTNIFI